MLFSLVLFYSHVICASPKDVKSLLPNLEPVILSSFASTVREEKLTAIGIASCMRPNSTLIAALKNRVGMEDDFVSRFLLAYALVRMQPDKENEALFIRLFPTDKAGLADLWLAQTNIVQLAVMPLVWEPLEVAARNRNAAALKTLVTAMLNTQGAQFEEAASALATIVMNDTLWVFSSMQAYEEPASSALKALTPLLTEAQLRGIKKNIEASISVSTTEKIKPFMEIFNKGR